MITRWNDSSLLSSIATYTFESLGFGKGDSPYSTISIAISNEFDMYSI